MMVYNIGNLLSFVAHEEAVYLAASLIFNGKQIYTIPNSLKTMRIAAMTSRV